MLVVLLWWSEHEYAPIFLILNSEKDKKNLKFSNISTILFSLQASHQALLLSLIFLLILTKAEQKPSGP